MPKTKRTKRDSVDTILAAYREKLPTYSEFATRCKELVEQLLRSKNVRVHSVTCRPKDVDRLKDKLSRPEKHYDRLTDVTDLAGVRIITHFASEVDEIATIIEREFKVLPEHSIDKRQALDPDRFGYLSLHYVCTLANKRARLTENAPYRHLTCEIQIRSILQHAWAEIEHNLGYTSAEAIPRSVRRRFCRLAALLETADSEFIGIRDDITVYAAKVNKDLAEKPTEVLLDKVSLRALIQRDAVARRMDQQLAEWAGATLEDADDSFLNSIVMYFRDLGMQTIEELRAALAQRERVIVRQFQIRVEKDAHKTLHSGISLYHLWQVLLAEQGGFPSLQTAFEKFHILGPETSSSKRFDQIIHAIQNAVAESEGEAP